MVWPDEGVRERAGAEVGNGGMGEQKLEPE